MITLKTAEATLPFLLPRTKDLCHDIPFQEDSAFVSHANY
jgi:hypothetical protein